MSLKAFHIVFIGISVGCLLGFGVWILLVHPLQSDALNLAGAGAAGLGAAGLVLYGVRFLRKYRHLSFL